VGLGATIALLATSSTADVTGMVAAGTMAALGLFVLPHRRRRAKKELAEKIDAMRTQLMDTLGQQFAAEAGRSRAKIRDTIAPYDRFVRAEQGLLEDRRRVLGELADRVSAMQARVRSLAPSAD
jgi:hypothetical protein